MKKRRGREEKKKERRGRSKRRREENRKRKRKTRLKEKLTKRKKFAIMKLIKQLEVDNENFFYRNYCGCGIFIRNSI